MTAKMKALRLHSPHDLRLAEEIVPDYAPDEVLLRIRSVGICASDVHYFNEGAIGDAVIDTPLVLGHEVGAEVVEVGSAVKHLQPGDKVAVEPARHCGNCPICEKGWINLCPNVQFFGTPPQDGAMREFVAWPEHLCLKVPDSLSTAEAAMTEPMAVGIYAMDEAKMQGGETVAVLGAGAIGLSTLQAVKMAGASRIWVTDPIPGRAELARKLGADVVITGDMNQAVQQIRQETGGAGVDIVFECAGTSEACDQGVHMATFNGRLMIVGIPYPDSVTLTASVARRKNLYVTFVRRSRHAVERAIQWAAEKKIDLKSYVTHTFPLDLAPEALRLAQKREDGVIRAVIEI